jgi:hypothetical protein
VAVALQLGAVGLHFLQVVDEDVGEVGVEQVQRLTIQGAPFGLVDPGAGGVQDAVHLVAGVVAEVHAAARMEPRMRAEIGVVARAQFDLRGGIVRLAHPRQDRAEFDLLKLDVDPHLGTHRGIDRGHADAFVIRRDQQREREAVGHPGLGQQGAGGVEVALRGLVRAVHHPCRGRERADCRHRRIAKDRIHHRPAVDAGRTRRAALPVAQFNRGDVDPDPAEAPAAHDRHVDRVVLLQAVDRPARHRVDDVDRTGFQVHDPRLGIDEGPVDHAVQIGQALLEVVVETLQHHPVVADALDKAERPGTNQNLPEIAAMFLGSGGRNHHPRPAG